MLDSNSPVWQYSFRCSCHYQITVCMLCMLWNVGNVCYNSNQPWIDQWLFYTFFPSNTSVCWSWSLRMRNHEASVLFVCFEMWAINVEVRKKGMREREVRQKYKSAINYSVEFDHHLIKCHKINLSFLCVQTRIEYTMCSVILHPNQGIMQQSTVLSLMTKII